MINCCSLGSRVRTKRVVAVGFMRDKLLNFRISGTHTAYVVGVEVSC